MANRRRRPTDLSGQDAYDERSIWNAGENEGVPETDTAPEEQNTQYYSGSGAQPENADYDETPASLNEPQYAETLQYNGEPQYGGGSAYVGAQDQNADTYRQDGFSEDGPYDGSAEEFDAKEDEPKKKRLHSFFKPRTKKAPFILSVAVNVVRIAAVLVVLAGLAGAGIVAGIARGYVETAPTLDLADLNSQAQTSFIYDSNGRLITEYKGVENRVMVSLNAIPKYLQEAFVAVEDSRFYTHNGVDLKRIVGAFVSNLSSSSTQGGSTITQQLIKNTVLSSEVSYKRKIQEAYLAIQLETMYTKDQILECYLNTIYLGENYYGVYVAAEGYFGKKLNELTLRECAMLAGMTTNPSYYNPRRNFYTRTSQTTDYAKITNNRTDYVLYCMYEDQYITKEQYEAALDTQTASVLESSPSTGSGMYDFAHYVEYAVSEVVDIFLELEGLEDTSANRTAMENKLRTGGYYVKLAIDIDIQQTVEDTLSGWTRYPSLKDPADKVYRSKNSNGTYDEIVQPQAAAVVLDYRTGELKAIVGSRAKVTARKTLNRATDMRMPVGSAIKPLSVYAPAIELGASPASIAYNIPVPITGWLGSNRKATWPRNYGGGGYTGAETLRSAITASHNTSAAYVLMNMVGVDRSVDFLHRMGVDDNHIDATPFGLALGSSGITPLQMSVAYGVLANGGVYQEPISVLGISDSEGNVIWDGHEHQERRRVFSESTAWLTVSMMKSVVAGGTASNAKISGQTVAGKTGTNSDQKGVSFSGMTGWYSSCVWIGHDNYKALSGKSSGGSSAAPLWQAYMSKIHKNLANRDIMDGDASQYGLVKVTTCGVSGQLATDACKNDAMGYKTVTDWWRSGTQPTTYCQMHVTQNVCNESGMVASPYCPSASEKGILVIPDGHPLSQYIGTEYDEALEKYFGAWASVRYGNDAGVCTLHTASTGAGAWVDNTLVPDARTLLSQAYVMLQSLDMSSAQYANVQAAISTLEYVLSQSNPDSAEITSAMSQLTRAMAGL